MSANAVAGVDLVERVKVLLVDDQPYHLVALRSMLEDPRYELVSASSGTEALKQLLRDEFAVILLDVVMPGMDGFETASMIRGRERTRDTPIIFLTMSATDAKAAFRGYTVGAVDFLAKPCEPEIVRAKVEVFAELHRGRLRLRRQAAELRETEKREQALRLAELRRESERRYRNLAEAVPHIVFTAGPDGGVDYVNSRWFELTGLGQERAAGWGWLGAIPEAEVEGFRRRWDAAVARGEPFQAQCRLRDRNGEERWQLCRALPELRRGHIAAWLGTFTDIHEQTEAQARAALLAEASRLLGSSLAYEQTLPHVARLLVPQLADGCSVEVGDQRLASAGIDPLALDSLEAARAEARQSAQSQIAGQSVIVPLVARDRTLGLLVLIAAPPRRLDDAVLATAENLADRIALAVDNMRLYREAQQAVAARDQFLQIAAHELKTPLTSLLLQLSSLTRALDRDAENCPLRERARDGLEAAARSSERIANLVEVLLDASRISAGRLQIERERLELAALARDVITRLGDEAVSAGCSVELRAVAPVMGEWDGARIAKVLANLLANALKYGRGRPVIVEVSAPDEDHARLCVRDHGIGLPHAYHERVFERFARAVSERNYGGLGLGLFIVREIVHAHGGTVAVDSNPGEGATFTVELPRR
jgi:PAS domain S-box-containing protein